MKASASKIKQFYNFTKGLYNITHKDVCDTIMGVKVDTFEKNMGTLGDAYIMDTLSDGTEYQKASKEIGKTLSKDAEAVLDLWTINFQLKHPLCATQCVHAKTYQTIFGDFTVSMRCDILVPNRVIDIKFSKYGIDAGNYLDDFQGKVYTNAFQVDSMVYEHFMFYPKTDEVKYVGAMEQLHSDDKEIVVIITQFIAFVRNNGLIKYLEDGKVKEG